MLGIASTTPWIQPLRAIWARRCIACIVTFYIFKTEFFTAVNWLEMAGLTWLARPKANIEQGTHHLLGTRQRSTNVRTRAWSLGSFGSICWALRHDWRGKDETCNHKMAKAWCISMAKSLARTNLKGGRSITSRTLGCKHDFDGDGGRCMTKWAHLALQIHLIFGTTLGHEHDFDGNGGRSATKQAHFALQIHSIFGTCAYKPTWASSGQWQMVQGWYMHNWVTLARLILPWIAGAGEGDSVCVWGALEPEQNVRYSV